MFAAAVPLAALWLTEGRIRRLRNLFSLAAPSRRALVGIALALCLLPALVAVAAAQPVVVRQQSFAERLDAQAFFVFDTSLSMSARTGPHAPTRLDRAKREAEKVLPRLGDIPVGIATMTDRVLPDLMPTPNNGLFLRTLRQSVGINRPPPGQLHRDRATTLKALFPIGLSHLYEPGVRHQILVVFTDGEANPLRSQASLTFAAAMTAHPLFVHVWKPTERIYVRGGIDPRYTPDPASGAVLRQFAAASGGRVFGEHDLGALVRTIRAEAGSKPVRTQITGYARYALGPWFVLAGVFPLGFLLWRRNL